MQEPGHTAANHTPIQQKFTGEKKLLLLFSLARDTKKHNRNDENGLRGTFPHRSSQSASYRFHDPPVDGELSKSFLYALTSVRKFGTSDADTDSNLRIVR